MIQPGQIYYSAKPGEASWRIRVTKVWTTSVTAVEARHGRPLLNRIPIRQLHASPLTKAGQPRRTGYVLEGGQTPA